MASNRAGKPATLIQSVERASQILKYVATSETPPSARDIGDALGLTMPTTYHLLGTLDAEGLLTRAGQAGISLGPAAALIANAVYATQTAPEIQLAGLRQLADETSEQVYLSTWHQGSIRVVESIEGRHVVSVNTLRVGYAENLHARASAKILLAFAARRARDIAVAGLEFERLTSHTIVDRATFEGQLDRVREERIAFDDEEFAEGVMCASVPVTTDGWVVASLTVSAPAERFRSHRDELIDALRRAEKSSSS